MALPPTTPQRPARILVIGAAHWDVLARSEDRLRLATSNPGHRLIRPGGVARNVAAALVRLGVTVDLVSRVGADRDGQALVADCARLGIETRAITASPTATTAAYLALLDQDGALVAAIADMAVYSELTPDHLAPILDTAAAADWWFADANLPAATLAAIAGHPRRPALAVDAVSVAKGARLAAILPQVACVFANRDEATALTGSAGDADAVDLARALVARGARGAIVTDGAHGLGHASSAGASLVCGHLAALPGPVVDVTGAGDALIAATLGALTRGLDLGEAARYGRAAAALAVATPGADAPLTPALLTSHPERLP